MRFPSLARPIPPDRIAIAAATFAEERVLAQSLANIAQGHDEETERIESLAEQLAVRLRTQRQHAGGIDSLLALYPLNSPEGRALLALVEALPRISDHATADQLIREKLGHGQWRKLKDNHKGSAALLSNLAARGLMLAGDLSHFWASEPLVRATLRSSMEWLGRQFVLAETIYDALESPQKDFTYSYDMLGEAALSEEDAQRHHTAYAGAIHHIGLAARGIGPYQGPGVSIKLSALHPRYSRQQRPRLRTELLGRLRELAISACEYNINFTLDAEESDRLDLQLELFAELANDPKLAGWDGLGLAVQAYQKRAFAVIEWLGKLAESSGRRFMVRLVKGAYWDSEIKRAQVQGLRDYPVFTHKAHTDLSYLACMRRLFELSPRLYPQIATHNPVTAAAAQVIAGSREFEYQCLHGMGDDLYKLMHHLGIQRPCRIYAPIGLRSALLPYLVRRMLENGANSSIIQKLIAPDPPVITAYPAIAICPSLPNPQELFAPRRNSSGMAWFNETMLSELEKELSLAAEIPQVAGPLLGENEPEHYGRRSVVNPADPADLVGFATESGPIDIENAIIAASHAASDWCAQSLDSRATVLEHTADLLEIYRGALINLLVREAGKTLIDAHAELREAVDFCRYYACEARRSWPNKAPTPLGVVLAISPWNFPLAIFIGQIAAALVTGNVVIAKPSEKTPLIAGLTSSCLLEAGVPAGVLQLLPGPGHIAAALLSTGQCNGVLFTGSLKTAQRIRRQLSEQRQDIPLVAETGGINAMIVDSSALAEQTVADIIASSFNSAGQRCSALRLLCVQDEIAAPLLHKLRGAITELRMTDPAWLDCDIGPLIDSAALAQMHDYLSQFKKRKLTIWQAHFDEHMQPGCFFPPTLVEINTLADLPGEIFGPLLCVLRYKTKKLPELLTELAATGYGLTLGLQSRLNSMASTALATMPVGNYYINRSQIGAVVGSQPFGGNGLSGTGPKAGGPWYLWRLVRDADACQTSAASAVPTEHHASPLARKLDEFARQWPTASESALLIGYFEDYARRTPIEHTQPLPGPTGENNTLHWRGRGTVAALGPTAFDLAHQIGAALLTGNHVILGNAAVAQQIIDKLPSTPISLTSHPLDQSNLDAVLICGSSAHSVDVQLAQRHGSIVPLITPLCSGAYPLFRLANEFTLTVNTAAAGGNLDLLSNTA